MNTLIIMNLALLAISIYAMVRKAQAEKRARWALGALRNIKANLGDAKKVLETVVGKPAMVRTDINVRQNYYLN